MRRWFYCVAALSSLTVSADETIPTAVGTVVSVDGEPVSGIEVLAFAGSTPLPDRFVTDEQGRFFVPRAWRETDVFKSVVPIDGGKRIGWFSFSMHKFSNAGQHSPDGSFRIVLLPLDRVIRGRLTTAERQPLAGIPVRVEFLKHDVNFFDSHWTRRRAAGARIIPGAVTDNHGRFGLRLPSGSSATLRAEHPDWAARRLQVKEDQTAVTDTRMVPAARVAGQVVDSRTGKPVEGVRVAARIADTNLALDHGGWGEATTDADGRYSIGSLKTGKWGIMIADCPDGKLVAPALSSVPLKSGETFTADFNLKIGRRISGRVLDHVTDRPVIGCSVHCAGSSGTAAVDSTQTDKDGRFEFFVSPGRSRVYVADRDTVPNDSRNLTVDAEEDPKAIILKAGPKTEINVRYFVGPPLERKVTLQANAMTFESALDEICNQSGLLLELDAGGLKLSGYTKNMKLDVDLQRVTLREALIRTLEPFKSLGFTLDGNRVFISNRDRVNAREAKRKRERKQKPPATTPEVSSRTQSFAGGKGALLCHVQGPAGSLVDAKVTVKLSVSFQETPSITDMLPGSVLHQTVHRTDGNGQYRIEIPGQFASRSDLRLSVYVEHPKCVSRSIGPVPIGDFNAKPVKRSIFQRMARTAILSTRLREATPYRGRVLLPDGSPAVGAKVVTRTKYQAYSWKHFSPDDYTASDSAETDSAGRFSVMTDQRSTMTVHMAGHAALLIDNLQAHVGLADGEAPNTLRLPIGIRPNGRVMTATGKPIPGAIVRARRNIAWSEFDMPLSFEQRCIADKNGEYTLPPIPADSYVFIINSRIADLSHIDEPASSSDGLIPFGLQAPSQPLSEVIPDVTHQLNPSETRPAFDFRAVQTATIIVRMEFPDGPPPDDRRIVDLTVTGKYANRRWSGTSVKADEHDIARLTVPKGAEFVVIGTGLATHRRSAEGPIEIGEAIHLRKVTDDVSDLIVTRPAPAKLKVELTHQIPATAGRISISAWHTQKGYRQQSSDKQRVRLVGASQNGSREYQGIAIPGQEIQLKITLSGDDGEIVLHEERLTLDTGETRIRKIEIADRQTP